MFRGKSTQFKVSPKKTKLDHFLWFVENYLPQKKQRATCKQSGLDKLEVITINRIQKIVSLRSKSLTPNAGNTKLSFTFGSWALPYLKILKQIGLAK